MQTNDEYVYYHLHFIQIPYNLSSHSWFLRFFCWCLMPDAIKIGWNALLIYNGKCEWTIQSKASLNIREWKEIGNVWMALVLLCNSCGKYTFDDDDTRSNAIFLTTHDYWQKISWIDSWNSTITLFILFVIKREKRNERLRERYCPYEFWWHWYFCLRIQLHIMKTN